MTLPGGSEPRFIHRDFHPGNLLLHRGRFSGIVRLTLDGVRATLDAFVEAAARHL